MPAETEKDPATIAYAKTLANTPWCDDYMYEKMISGVLYDLVSPQSTTSNYVVCFQRIC